MNRMLWLLLGLASLIVRPIRADRPARETSARAQRWNAIAAIAAWIAAGAASGGLIAAFWAVKAAQEQLRVMRAEQRPWIKVEPEEIGDFETTGGLLGPDAVQFISFKLTNVGRTPAFNVRFLVWGTARPFRAEQFFTRKEVLEEQHGLCDDARHRFRSAPEGSAIIFPEDPPVLDKDLAPPGARVVTTSSMNGEIDRALHEGDGKNFLFYIVGCADYAFEGGITDHHQTGIVYQILHIADLPPGDPRVNVLTPAFKPDESIPADRIRLHLFPSASGQTD